MAEREPSVSLTPDAWRRMSRAVRAVEKRLMGRTGTEKPDDRDPGAVAVIVIGDPFDMKDQLGLPPATTSGTGTTTSTTTTTTSSTGTGTTTTVAPPPEVVYPGMLLVRKSGHAGKNKEKQWYENEECYVQEIEGRPLGFLCRYIGFVVDYYENKPLVVVWSDAGDEPCDTSSTSSTTTTSFDICSGECVWDLNETTRIWSKTEDTCEDGCECPPPDFCPPDYGCATVHTFCARDLVPGAPPVCTTTTSTTTTTGTGTTTTSSTGTTTTTTTTGENPCGTGCWWKYVPDLPGSPYVAISQDCDLTYVFGYEGFPDGFCQCISCPLPDPVPCIVQFTPCLYGCYAPPPPVGCRGVCEWVWPDIEGVWWVLNPLTACTTDIFGQNCRCDPPSMPGGECNQKTHTPCFVPVPPTTSGTGTTTTGTGTTTTSSTGTTTTTTRGDCGGYCYLRWDPATSDWAIIDGCPGCTCSEPLYGGGDGCDVAKVPCVTTTTGTTTTTTSSTTTTTTTTGNCTQRCVRTCDGVDLLVTTPCPGDCECADVTTSAGVNKCTGAGVGQTFELDCHEPCDEIEGRCCFACLGAGYWQQCSNGCEVGGVCVYPEFPCDAGSEGNMVCTLCTETPPPTTTSTSSTGTTTTVTQDCGGAGCLWECSPLGWVLISGCPDPCICPLVTFGCTEPLYGNHTVTECYDPIPE